MVEHCYGPQRGESSRETRREALRSHYFFECECHICKMGDQDPVEVLLSAIRCPNQPCASPVGIPGCAIEADRAGPTRLKKLSLEPSSPGSGMAGKCEGCAAEVGEEAANMARGSVGQGLAALALASDQAGVGKYKQALATLAKWDGPAILHPLHPLVGQANHTRSRLLFETKNFPAAFQASVLALDSVAGRFSEGSLPRGNAAAWAAALAATAQDGAAAGPLAREAASSLEVHYGTAHPNARLLRALARVAEGEEGGASNALALASIGAIVAQTWG